MYFILKNDILMDNVFEINDPKDISDELRFMSGSAITLAVKNPLVFTTTAKQGDQLRDFDDRTIPLMSKRFLEIIQGAGVDNVQAFPVVIESEVDGTKWGDYFAVNILGRISCAELDKSEYTEIMPGHYRFRELAIDAEKTKGALLFRLQEHTPTILMHKTVGKYIIENDPEETLLGWDIGDVIQ